MESFILVDGRINKMVRDKRLGMDFKLYLQNMFIKDSFYMARDMEVVSLLWMGLGLIKGNG